MADVFANSRSILHAGDGNQHVAGPPDVCKTPSPGGPIPIPYPNIAMDSDLAKGTKKVKINGKSVATEAANLSTSTGDEAGTAGGGLISSKTKGKLTWGSASTDVKAEGNGVARFMDVTQHNGNIFNTVITALGEPTTPGYGDDPIDGTHCSICGKKKKKHRMESDKDIEEKIKKLRDALLAAGGAFQTALSLSNADTKRKPGFMIGVLACFCKKTKPWAGISGNAPAAFARCRTAFETTCNPDFVPVVVPHSEPPPPLTGLSKTTPFKAISPSKWKDVVARTNAVREIHGGPPMFACAGPKIVQECLKASHKPFKMVEMWLPNKCRTVTIATRTVLRRTRIGSPVPDKTVISVVGPTDFGGDDFVPSCTTCQVQLTAMLCRIGKPPCP